MKHLKASKTFESYKTVTMEIKDLVPASVYETIPDYDTLLPELKEGKLEYPLLVYQAHPDYWTKNHLGLYRSSSPTLPTHAPVKEVEIQVQHRHIKEPRVHVVWSGRQRFQIAQELDYTHVDCIVEPNFFKMVEKAGVFRKMNKK